MLNRDEIRRVFRKKPSFNFKGERLRVWTIGYWFAQPVFVTFHFPLFYSKFRILGFENIPKDKPVLFAISHRNAFMDSLALANAKSIQVWQLARGDAFKNKYLQKLFYFFHMLPLWRERDGVNTKDMNQPTFDACADILSLNGMVGIYPEGNCINEDYIRPLKKGICRIAFMAEQRYDYSLDVHIIPVGISYSDAENFKSWQLINFGEPILLKKYSELHKSAPAFAVNQLKEEIEKGMQKLVLHVPHSDFHEDIVAMTRFYARNEVISHGKKYEPVSKLNAEQSAVKGLEKLRVEDAEKLKMLADDFHQYQSLMKKNNFRENTFDPPRRHPFTISIMALYFLFLFPVFIFGLIANYIPFKLPQWIVEKKVKEKIFWASAKYVIGWIIFPVWYLLLAFLIYHWLGSMASALIFFLAFPISGNIAWYYAKDFKKWWSVLRFNSMKRKGDPEFNSMLRLRQQLIDSIRHANYEEIPNASATGRPGIEL